MPEVFKKGKPFPTTDLNGLISTGLSKTVKLRRDKLFGSSSAYCPRQAVIFTLLPPDYEGPQDAASQFYFSIGTAVHNTVQDGLQRAGVLVAREERFALDDIGLSGIVDGIVKLEGANHVLEIKTCGNLPAKPKYEHVAQATVYSLATGLRDPIILYVSRNVADWRGSLIMRTFHLSSDDIELKSVAKRLATSFVFMKAGVLPAIPKHITSARDCGFCPFVKMCWEGASFPVAFDVTVEERETLMKEAITVAKQLIKEMPALEKYYGAL